MIAAVGCVGAGELEPWGRAGSAGALGILGNDLKAEFGFMGVRGLMQVRLLIVDVGILLARQQGTFGRMRYGSSGL